MPPRPLRPKDDPGPPEGSETALAAKGNKRRAVSAACIPCRRRKSKCDGALPSCSTCTAVYRTECSYDPDSDHRRKGALKRDIESLQQQNDALDVIVASLRDLPESEAVSLLHNLRSEMNLDALADSLKANVKLPQISGFQTLEADFAEQLSTTPSNSKASSSVLTISREDSAEDTQTFSGNINSPELTTRSWFRVPQDAEFVDHLLNLYFCWIHPFYHFFSRDHFLHDMSRGRVDFCSSILINAVMSFACHYSDRRTARTEPDNSNTSGDFFFAEAKRLLDKMEKPSLTTVQALGIMSVRETSHGRDSSGYQYAGRCVRMALELGLHLAAIGSGLKAAENEVRKITFWSVFNLETLFSVSVGRLSQLPRSAADVQKPAVTDRTENQTWEAYEDSNVRSVSTAEQPARTMLFLDQLSKLSEIASDMVNSFYAPQERFTSRRLAMAYSKYQEWYQNIPDAFQLQNTSLPHVLVLHMYYYGCVLHLFRPYIKLDLQGVKLFPRDTCTFCANEISALMNVLRTMYGLRRTSLPIASLLLSASTIHLLNLPSEQPAAHLSQAMNDLQTMSLNHQFAARCVEIIQALALKWNIQLPEGATPSSFLPQTQLPSPQSSNFWAASIPRKASSADASSQSSGPTPTHQESAFLQPSLAHQQPDYATFFSDPTVQLDPNQTQAAFWTPFPSQTMPVPSQNIIPSMSMEFSSMEEQSRQWSLVDRSGGGTISQHSQSHPAQGSGSGQPTNFENWHWQ